MDKKMQTKNIPFLLIMLVIFTITFICDIIFLKANVHKEGFITTFGLALTPSIGAVGACKSIANKKELKSDRNIQFMSLLSLFLPYIPLTIYVIKTSQFLN